MSRWKALVRALSCACAIVALVVGHAAANRLSLTSQTFREVGRAVRIATERESQPVATCPLTLEGTFHSSSFAKTAGTEIGYVTRASMNESACTGARAGFKTETLPWPVQYKTFSGTLPSFESFQRTLTKTTIIRYGGFGSLCFYDASAAEPIIMRLVREAGGGISKVLYSGSIGGEPRNPVDCWPELVFEEEAEIDATGGIPVTVRLI